MSTCQRTLKSGKNAGNLCDKKISKLCKEGKYCTGHRLKSVLQMKKDDDESEETEEELQAYYKNFLTEVVGKFGNNPTFNAQKQKVLNTIAQL